MLEVSENQDYPFGDIVAQPQTWHSIVDAAEAFAPLFYSRWLAQTGQEVIFTGCGSPYCLAQTAALLYQGMTGLAARAYPASEILRFPQLTLTGDPRLLVAFSRSGEDTETVGAVKAFQANIGKPVVAIVCNANTSLERAADASLIIPRPAEVSLAENRALSEMLVATQVLISHLASMSSLDRRVRMLTPRRYFVDQEGLSDLERDAAFTAGGAASPVVPGYAHGLEPRST